MAQTLDDAACERLGRIFQGGALDAAIRNTEYHVKVNPWSQKHKDTLENLQRAKELRDADQ